MDEELTFARATAMDVRRGVLNLSRRLRLERSASSLTGLELSVLGHLFRRGPLTPGDLASVDHVQPQSLTRTLAGLEASGLTLRESDPGDGRRSLLTLTESGRAALRAEMDQRDSWLGATMAAQLTSAEIGVLRLAAELLQRLADC